MKKTTGIHHATAIVGNPQENVDFYAGVLLEIATDPPGFLHNEPFDQLGGQLLLPPHLEPHRKEIEHILLPANVRVLEGDQ